MFAQTHNLLYAHTNSPQFVLFAQFHTALDCSFFTICFEEVIRWMMGAKARSVYGRHGSRVNLDVSSQPTRWCLLQALHCTWTCVRKHNCTPKNVHTTTEKRSSSEGKLWSNAHIYWEGLILRFDRACVISVMWCLTIYMWLLSDWCICQTQLGGGAVFSGLFYRSVCICLVMFEFSRKYIYGVGCVLHMSSNNISKERQINMNIYTESIDWFNYLLVKSNERGETF